MELNPQVARFRLRCSRAFWFGVPGLVFLLWAWDVSMRKPTTVWLQWKASKYPDIIQLHDGALKVSHEPGSFGGSLVPVKVQAKQGKASYRGRCGFRP